MNRVIAGRIRFFMSLGCIKITIKRGHEFV